MNGTRATFGLRDDGHGVPLESAAMPSPLAHLRRLAGDLCAVHLLRQAVFLAALLLAWVSLRPFGDLSSPETGEIVTGQESLTYASFGLLALSALTLVLREHGRALAALASRSTLLLAAWLCLSVVFSQDPATSMKRLGLTAAVVGLTACLPLLPRSRGELGRLLAIATLALLGLCYAGMIVAPHLSIHQPGDFLEPQLAGNWRGSFGHKNAAAAVMAMVLIIGVAVFRAGQRLSGAAIVGLAGLFLIGAEGKSAAALIVIVFALSGLMAVITSTRGRAVLVFGPLLLFNLFTVGTVLNEGLAGLVARLPIDATFTGRTDVWRFAFESIAARPIVGYGFSAFWQNQSVRDASDDGETWAGYASHSHNGFVDTTLTLGSVGLVLMLVVVVIAPFRDYLRLQARGPAGPFATMFLQIWLFGLLLSTMESFFFDRGDPIWITFLLAVFGLRYTARFETR